MGMAKKDNKATKNTRETKRNTSSAKVEKPSLVEDDEFMEDDVMEDDVMETDDEIIETVEAELLPYNPLLQRPAFVIDPEDETDQKVQLMEETDSLVELNEQNQKAKQRKARLEIELGKIKAAKDLTKLIDRFIEVGFTEDVVLKVIANTEKALDLKHLSDALKNFTEARNNNMENLINDEFGRRRKTKIMAAFRTRSGEEAVMSMELPDGE